MNAPVFVIGLGQLGVAFSEGFLKLGTTVVPLLRGANIQAAVSHHGSPELVLVAVGEDDLSQVLSEIPQELHGSLVLLQNELRPATWLGYVPDAEPTVVIVWFEKKPGRVAQPVLPSVIYGAKGTFIMDAFDKMQLPARTIASNVELAHELTMKNLYILGLNLTGLVTQGRAGELLTEHESFFSKICEELISLEQTALASVPDQRFSQIVLNGSALREDLRAAISADPNHGCAGRSAPRRLERTLELAKALNLSVPTIAALQSKLP